MRQLKLADYEINRDYSVWPIDFAISASFEMPAAELQAALPPDVHLLEARPGVGLLNVAVFHFTADTHGLTEPCSELVVSAHIIPNIARAPMLPRSAMFTFRLGATSREFIDSAFATDRYPVFPDPIDVRIARSQITADVRDAEGDPILWLGAAEGASPPYAADRFYVQSMTASDGRLYASGNLFEFRRAENQRNLQSAGRLVPHAFFGGLGLSSLASAACYVQMWSEPGTTGCENHFFLRPI